MDAIEPESQKVFRIIDRKTGKAVGSYSRAYHDEFDFSSAQNARHANCYGEFEDKEKYAIAQYHVYYALVNSDVID